MLSYAKGPDVPLLEKTIHQVVDEMARVGLNHLLPPRRGVATAKRDGQHQRRTVPVQVSAGHPGPGKGPAAAKGDLALAHLEPG